MISKKYLSLLFFLVSLSAASFAQPYIKGIIVEKNSKLPIAFASVTYQKGSVLQGVISDIHGKFEIPERDIKSLQVSCVGYQKNRVALTAGMKLSDLVVELRTDTLSIGEVTITPAMNPAVRIIRNVLKNKEKNNFENYDKYTYQCYLKTILNLKLSYNATAKDSATIRKNKDMNKHARFISESMVLSSTVNKRTEKKVIAVKTSGFENPLFGQYFVSMFHNAISFYKNNIALFAMPVSDDMSSSEYLSPVSNECIRSYNYLLEETYENPSDTLYMIEFHPKKGSNFNGLKGRLYISSNGWAIKNIVTEPYEKGLIDFRFRQDYEFIDGRWFPSGLDEEIGFVSMRLNKNIQAIPVYLITSRISNVSFNPDITVDSIKFEKVYLDEELIKNSESIINSSRPDSLTAIEKNTYQFMDSIGGKFNFDYWADLYPSISAGKIPIKFIDIDLEEFFRNNDYEGTRIGIGLSTNDKLSKVFSAGGFGGYGIKDKEFKYGGHITFNIDDERETELKLSYQNNLKEPGLDQREEFSLLSTSDYLRDYIAYRMDNFVEERAEFNFHLTRYLKIGTSVSFREIMPTYEYYYKGSPLTDFLADEIKISARYAYGEEIHMFGNQKIVFYAGNPILSISYKRGIDLFNRDSYNYNRYEAALDLTAYKGKIGQTDIRFAGGFIDKPLPYSLLFTGEGSKSGELFLINNTFQTMKPYEFLSDRYVNIFFSHNFGTLLLETPRFKPRIILAHNTGWGTLRNASDHSIDFKLKDKIYLESGLLINNIIRFKIFNLYYIGFGGGTFYRYGHYGYDKVFDNLALKVSITVALE
ncbi:MAG: DUF5686 family protein [Bacteroidia bacterium]|nr:DUF5686 family protein [Bacteroidia bacterium]